MRVAHRWKIAAGLLLWGPGIGISGVQAGAQAPSAPSEAQVPPPLDGPLTGLEALPAPGTAGDLGPADAGSAGTGRVHVPKPPPPIAERPSGERPDPRAQWISGHWKWDPARNDFVWIAGSWRIPPPGMSWVAGRWLRDADGWYWVPGSWSRRDRAVVATDRARPAWRTTGPPADHPDDTPAPAPGPDYFFVPGHYAPFGDRLVWIPGVWARVQPGWDWIPARWIRRPSGWEFREGYWVRDPATVIITTRVRRRFAARPGAYGRPPAVVESERSAAHPDGATDRPPPPPYPTTPRDPTAGAEASGRPDDSATTIITEFPEIIMGPITGMPYYVIRPPGTYPYGPNGVIVPGVVPPFVRRMLDRILP